jgi:hypothetical protein
MVRKLEDNGVPVTLVHMSDQMHGFLNHGPRHSCVGVRAGNGWHVALARAFNSKQTAAPTQELKGVAFG